MDRVSFTVPGEPVPWQRAGVFGSRHFKQPESAGYHKLVRDCAAVAMRGAQPFTGACAVSMVAYLAIPRSWGLKRARMALGGAEKPKGRPDCDNLAKGALDALGAQPKRGKKPAEPGVVWNDDAQVTELRVVKRYSDRPRLEVSIVHLEAKDRGVAFVPTEDAA